jgi:hypothetical protein
MRRNDEVARTEGDRAITFPKLQSKTHFHTHTNVQNLAQELRKQLSHRIEFRRGSVSCEARHFEACSCCAR